MNYVCPLSVPFVGVCTLSASLSVCVCDRLLLRSLLGMPRSTSQLELSRILFFHKIELLFHLLQQQRFKNKPI